MNFLDLVKKYATVISFLFGVATGALTMYYSFKSKIETVDYKLDLIQKTIDREFENVYDVFHVQKTQIDKLKKP